MPNMTTEARAALAETSTEGLLRAAYSFTHRIHEADNIVMQARAQGWTNDPTAVAAASRQSDLRAQRDLITAEVLRRTADYDALHA